MRAAKSSWTRVFVIVAALVMVGTALTALTQGATIVSSPTPALTVTSNPSSPTTVAPPAASTSPPSASSTSSSLGAKVLTINTVLANRVKQTEQTLEASGGSLASYHPPNLHEGQPTKETGGVVTPLYNVAPAPLGVAYYGLSNTTGTVQGTTVDTSSIVGFWNTTDPTGTRATLTDTSSGNGAAEYGAQLNTVLVNVSLQGNTVLQPCTGSTSSGCNDAGGCPTQGDYVGLTGNVCPNEFWLQNYIQYTESSHSLTISGEIWNFSNPAADWYGSGPATIEGFGSVEDDEVYQSPSSGTITLPAGATQQEYTVALYFNYTQGPCRLDTGSGVGLGVPSCGTISTTEPVNELFLNYTVWNAAGQKICPTSIPSGRVCGEFDVVFFNSVGPSNPNGVPRWGPNGQLGSALMQANGTAYDPVGLTNDFEFDYGIGSDDGATNFIDYQNGSVAVDYCPTANTVEEGTGATSGQMSCGTGSNSLRDYVAPPAAYDFGGETGETSTGESVYWAPQGAAGVAPGLNPELGPSTPVAHITTGPSLLIGLWNATGSTVPGTPQPYTGISQSPYPAYTGGTPFSYANIAPANAWVGIAQDNLAPVAGTEQLVTSQEYFQVAPTFGWWSYWQGSGGDPSHTLLGPDEYLPSGWYTIEVLLSGYNPVVEQINVTGNSPVAPSITLTPNWSTGAYTPDWAFSNNDLANLSVSPSNTVPNGAGTSVSPYIISAPAPDVGTVDGVVIGEPGSVSWLFSNVNDYLFTQWIGAYINSTTAVTQFNPAPSFPMDYPSWQLYEFSNFDVPSVDGFQYYLLNTANLAVIGASDIYAFGNSEATTIYSFVVNNGVNDLIADNTFEVSNRGIDITGGGTTGDPTVNGVVVARTLYPVRNVVWGNTIVPDPQTSYMGLEPFTASDSLTIGESYDRVYNNYFASNAGDNASVNAGSTDTNWWNATCVAGYNALASGYYPGTTTCAPLGQSQTLDGYTMSGSIDGTSYQGGNEWALYGNNPNPYGNLPLKARTTSETGTAEIGAAASGATYSEAGDFAPLITTTVYNADVAETGLPSSSTTTEFETAIYSGTTVLTFNDTQTTTPTATCSGDPCLDFYLPSGSYTAHGYSSAAYAASPLLDSFSISGASIGLAYTFSFVTGYSVTFTETGLASGKTWNETVAGLTITSTATTHVFTLANGAYTYQSTPLPTGYTTTTAGYSGGFTVSSATVAESVPFYLQLTAPAKPTVSTTVLDANQALTVTGTIPTTGAPTYSWAWQVSAGGEAFGAATQCLINSGSGALAAAIETCSVPANTLTGGSTYAFELQVTDSAYSAETQTSVPSNTVTVGSTLAAPGTPSVSATSLDRNQALTVTGSIPTTGTAPYTWEWLASVGGGAYVAATVCSVDGGSGASSGATELCSVSANTLTVGDTYAFELNVTDSASTPENTISPSSQPVTVSSALTAPGTPSVSVSALDANQVLTVTYSLPSSGTAPYAWVWLVSDGGAYVDATQCTVASGSGASAGALETCSIGANLLAAGNTYTFELEVTDSASSPEVATSGPSASVAVASALTAPTKPSLSATALDVDQALTVTSTLATTGTSTYSWQWLVSVEGSSYGDASQCAVESGSGASGGATETCSVSSGMLSVGSTYVFELVVTDSATVAETATSPVSSTVNVASTLTAPSTPTPSTTVLDADQALSVASTLATTGSSPYAWEWLVSADGGSYGSASSVCAISSGSGAAGGATETCSIAGGTLSAGYTYSFELKVTDSATAAESVTSTGSAPVSVSSALSAPAEPSVSATSLDYNQALTVTSTLPTTGTAPYAWTWLVSINSGSYGAAALCTTNGGSGAAGGTTETCSIGALTLTIGDTYSFELKVTDSAATPESKTSMASSTVTVSSTLGTPNKPTVNRPELDANQILTVTGKLPSSGTAPYAWQWLISEDSGAFTDASVCSVAYGSGGAAAAKVQCSIPANSLVGGNYYTFELQVTDSASSPETTTSAQNLETVSVATTLGPAATPTVSATALDLNQPLTVTSTLPTSGTAPYAYEWQWSINGGKYQEASACGVVSVSGAPGGLEVTCSIAAGALHAGDTYAFELKVVDSSTETATTHSDPSSGVKVSKTLTAPAKPSVSSTRLVVSQTLTVTGTLPSTGSATFTWQWLVSVNGGGYVDASQCSQNSGSGGANGAQVTCTISGNTLTVGYTYSFELVVTDGATVSETATSAASRTVTVVS